MGSKKGFKRASRNTSRGILKKTIHFEKEESESCWGFCNSAILILFNSRYLYLAAFILVC